MKRPMLALSIALLGCSSAGGEAPSDAGASVDAVTETPGTDGLVDATLPDGGPLAKCGFVSADPKCQACLEASCCALGRACAASEDCTTELRRRHACLDCNDVPPEDVRTFDQCLVKSCHLECGGVTNVQDIAHGYKGVGDPCTRPDACITGRCSYAHACVRACESDLDCAGYPDLEDQQVVHVCVATTKGQKLCLPRCDVQADCTARSVKFAPPLATKSEPLRCAEVGASHKACVLQRDTGAVPACYANDDSLGGTPCIGSADCLCGTSCETGGGSLGSCHYTCTTNASCETVTDGILPLCFHGSGGSSSCGT